MACFIVPTTEAVIATIANKVVKSKEKKALGESDNHEEGMELHAELHSGINSGLHTAVKVPFSRKLSWLTNMLWGGSALLAFEHLWHGEIVPWAPFLTAAANPDDTAAMLHEMSTVGVTMAVLVTAAWGCMVAVSNMLEKKSIEQQHTIDMTNVEKHTEAV